MTRIRKSNIFVLIFAIEKRTRMQNCEISRSSAKGEAAAFPISLLIKLFFIAILSFVLGILISVEIFPEDLQYLPDANSSKPQQSIVTKDSSSENSRIISPTTQKKKAMEIFETRSAMQVKKVGDPFFVIHHNGNVDGCGIIPPSNQTLHCKFRFELPIRI